VRGVRFTLLLLVLLLGGSACTGVHMGVGVRGGYYPWGYGYGRAPFYGYGDRVIVVPPDCSVDCGGGIDPDYPEAVPLPEPPPDMGMPDMGPMDMGGYDAGGFDF